MFRCIILRRKQTVLVQLPSVEQIDHRVLVELSLVQKEDAAHGLRGVCGIFIVIVVGKRKDAK